ncbi:MAG: AI-2E family transporter [Ruminococcus sp.]|nr:AI-2E family transporter [Ruminococcus sp.]
MKKYTNSRYNTIAIYVIVVIAIALLMVLCVFEFSTILNILGEAINVLKPVIWGFAIAFILNPVMKLFDKLLVKYIFKKKPYPRLTRAISVSLVTILFLLLIFGVIAIILPSLLESLLEIFKSTPELVSKVQDFINNTFKNNQDILNFLTEKLTSFSKDTTALWTQIEPMITNLMSSIWSVLTFLKNFLIGIIISIYLLYSKERLIAQAKKITLAFVKKKRYDTTARILGKANKTFSGFISGKLLDSLIIGVLCGIILTVFNFPYPLMISVFVGVTNIIPFFGPFIGAIPSAILILLVEPKMVIWFVIIIVILQQFDGNILGPKILGDSTGLPAIWVLISILVGGGLFGFLGMLLAVPTFALIYDLFREYICERLKKKHLPTSTEFYKSENPFVYETRKGPHITKEKLDDIVIPPSDDVNQAK